MKAHYQEYKTSRVPNLTYSTPTVVFRLSSKVFLDFVKLLYQETPHIV